MKARGLFSTLWVMQGFLVLICLLSFFWLIRGAVLQGEREQAANNLHERLRLTAPRMLWAMESPVQLQEELRELGREMGARLFLVGEGQEVLADSLGLESNQVLPSSLFTKKEGWLVWSGPEGKQVLAYFPLEFAEGQGLVAMGLGNQGQSLWLELEGKLLWTLGLILLFAAGGSGWYLSLLLAPLKNLHQGAERLARGELGYRLRPEGWRETRKLAQDFNWLAREAAQRLKQAEDRRNALEALFQGVDEGFLLLDASGHLIRLNKAAREILGVSRPDLEGCGILELIRHPGLAELAKKAQSGLAPIVEEFDLRQPERRIRVAAFSLSLREQQGLLLVLRDRTQLHRLERVRQEFVSNVSHELKTPVTAIQGFAETLMNGALDDPEAAKRFVGIIFNHAQSLTELIEDLLSLARLEEQSSQDSLPMKSCDVRGLMDRAVEVVQVHAQAKGIEIQLKCDESLKVQGNSNLLIQCLVNLLENAVKYSPEQTLVKMGGWQSGDQIFMEVVDQGEGIPQGERGRIFERFYRVDKSRSRNTGGTGLGLSIVKNTMALHGGKIQVEAVNPQGSRFLLNFPSSNRAGEPKK